MHEFISQVHDSMGCPVRNCTIGMTLWCPAGEIQQSLQFGKLNIKRNASYAQPVKDATGCENFFESDYEIQYIDSMIFTLIAGLVKYGSNMQDIFHGTHDTVLPEGEWSVIRERFDNLRYLAMQANRRFFTPEQIVIEGKPYEIAAVIVCNQLTCTSNNGKTDIDPPPLIMK
jgi:hypothetical protein